MTLDTISQDTLHAASPSTGVYSRHRDDAAVKRWHEIRRAGRAARRDGLPQDANPFLGASKSSLDFEEWIMSLQAWAAGWRGGATRQDGADALS